MPGAFTHVAFNRVLATNPAVAPHLDPVVRSLLDSPAAAFGSLGPDAFYFAPDDWPGIGELMKWYFQFEKELERIEALIKEISDLTTLPDPVAILGEEIFTAVRDLLHTVLAAIMSGALEKITAAVDVYELITPAAHKGDPINLWYWTDLVHNKQTARYAEALLRHAHSDEQRAYAYGYLSHFVSDAVGHGWTNLLTGGPYRNHWRRHALIEKWLDTANWDLLFGEELASSNSWRWAEFAGGGLPDPIADQIHRSLGDVYGGIRGTIPHDDLKICYSHLLRFLRNQSSRSMLNLPPIPPFDWFTLDDTVKRILDSLSNPPYPGSAPSAGASPLDWLRFLRELWDFARWCYEMALRIVLLPVKAILAIPETAFRLVLWLLQKLVFDGYETIRLALALGAHIHPLRSQLGYLPDIVSPNVADLQKLNGPYERHYVSSGQAYHLIHPGLGGAVLESPHAIILPAVFNSVNDVLFGHGKNLAEHFLTEPLVPGKQLYEYNASAANVFAAAVDLVQHHRPLVDLTLDSDRGFGWCEWTPKHAEPWTVNSFQLDPH